MGRSAVAVTTNFTIAFLAFLLPYLAWSTWARISPRYAFTLAMGILVAAAAADSTGYRLIANSLAEFFLLLLIGGVALLIIDQLRENHEGRNGGSFRPSPGHTNAP
jgi:uncharacterized membrane protein YfcA